MYITHSETSLGMPKAYREPIDPGFIWVKNGENQRISYSLEEAQALVTEVTRELQAEIAAAQVQS